MIYKQTTELYHSGIKGQKWGIRRYQNEDGTLTEAGKERYKDIKNIYRSGMQTARSVSNIEERSKRNKAKKDLASELKKTEESLKNMSDDDLRKIVNRMNLEEQYKIAKDKRSTQKGKASTKEILDTFGDVVGIIGGLAGIAVVVSKIIDKAKK